EAGRAGGQVEAAPPRLPALRSECEEDRRGSVLLGEAPARRQGEALLTGHMQESTDSDSCLPALAAPLGPAVEAAARLPLPTHQDRMVAVRSFRRGQEADLHTDRGWRPLETCDTARTGLHRSGTQLRLRGG